MIGLKVLGRLVLSLAAATANCEDISVVELKKQIADLKQEVELQQNALRMVCKGFDRVRKELAEEQKKTRKLIAVCRKHEIEMPNAITAAEMSNIGGTRI